MPITVVLYAPADGKKASIFYKIGLSLSKVYTCIVRRGFVVAAGLIRLSGNECPYITGSALLALGSG